MERGREDSSPTNVPAACHGGQLSAQQSSQIFYDEEDLLGYKIWVAELELLVSQRSSSFGGVGTAGMRHGRSWSRAAEFGPYYMLLQKLDATVMSTSIVEVREYQRRCEDALVDILLSGAPPPVRRLICGILSKMYAVGDSLPLYSRVSSLQLFLGTKEAFESRKTSEDIRLGCVWRDALPVQWCAPSFTRVGRSLLFVFFRLLAVDCSLPLGRLLVGVPGRWS